MLKLRAPNARIAGVFSGILFAIIGGFAAGVAEKANAQEAQVFATSDAVQVYQVSAYLPSTAIFRDQQLPLNITLSASVESIMTFLFDGGGQLSGSSTPTNDRHRTEIWELISDSGVTTAADDDAMNDLPVFGGEGVMRAGHRVRLFEAQTGADGVSDFDFTLRVYDRGGVLYLATEEGVAAELSADDEFFLTEEWAHTNARVAAEGLRGFVAPPPPLTAMDCAEMTPPQMLMGEICVPIPPENTATVTTALEASAKKDGVSFGGVVGIGAVAFLAILISRGGEEGEFGFSPKYGYSLTESGYSANVGGRMDFRKDEWTLFYTGGQANANGEFGEFRYSSGGEYKADFWKAAFSESVQGKTANYDLSLSADLSGGIWSLSPVYRLHSRLEEGESATRNSLNLEGVLEYERWTIRQSAGFGWRRAENFGDNARFRLEAVREF